MSAVRIVLAALLLFLGANRAVAELMSADDHQAYQAAFAAARAGAWSAMKRSAAAATERAPAKILLWQELTRGNMAQFADIEDFIDHNPEWPAQDVLRHRAEEAMVGVPDAVLQSYFQKHRPVTTMGKLRLADIFGGGTGGIGTQPRPRSLAHRESEGRRGGHDPRTLCRGFASRGSCRAARPTDLGRARCCSAAGAAARPGRLAPLG